jgi:hypothetical protein
MYNEEVMGMWSEVQQQRQSEIQLLINEQER